MLLMRTAGSRRNVNLFLVGDQAFGVPPLETSEYLPFNFMDAITNYDNYGTLPKPYATNVGLEKYYRQQSEWRELARRQDCKFIPSVSPGYNDRGVRLEADHPPLSRKLNGASDDFGSFFRFSLRKAIPLIDRGVDRLIMVNSFNEWHEDTQIEPVIGKLTREPRVYTGGIEYEGYNTRYLDILNRMTTNGSWIAEENFENEWLEQLINRKENKDKNTRPLGLSEHLRPNRRRRKRGDVFDSIEDNFNL
jgi:Glycosyl hydrolase family 99